MTPRASNADQRRERLYRAQVAARYCRRSVRLFALAGFRLQDLFAGQLNIMICDDARGPHALLQIFAELRLGVGALRLEMPQTGPFALDRFSDHLLLSRRMLLVCRSDVGAGQNGV